MYGARGGKKPIRPYGIPQAVQVTLGMDVLAAWLTTAFPVTWYGLMHREAQREEQVRMGAI